MPKMIKLLITDVDGTLLDSNSNLPALNRKALLSCIENNIQVILATGKSINSILPIVKLLDLKLPQITLNGAVTVNRDLKIINSVKMGPDKYLRVVREIKKKGYSPFAALVDGKIFFEKYHPDMKYIKKVGERLIKVDSIETGYFSKNSVSIGVPIKETDPLDSYLRNKFSDELQIVRSGEYFFDILSHDATKGNAVANIARILNIKKEEIVVFGDSYNDLSMFREAGLKIAVKNSYPKVLEEADIIADENYNCGLGKAIYRYILK